MKQFFTFLNSVFLLSFLINPFTCIEARSQAQWKWKNPLPEGNPIADVTVIDGNSLIAVGMLGLILKSDDFGETWYSCESGVGSNLVKVDFCDDSYGWIAGESGVILHTTDGGEHWIQQSSQVESHLTDIIFLDRDTGYVVGFNGTVQKTVNGGEEWLPLILPDPSHYKSVSFTNTLNGWISSSGNNVHHTNDGGNTWTVVHPVELPVTELDLMHVQFVSEDTGWVTGYGMPMPILRTVDGGISWQQQGNFYPMCGCFMTTDMSFLDSNRGWISGLVWDVSGGIIYWTEDGGNTWFERMIWSPISGIQLLESGTGVAVGAGHALYPEYYYYDNELEYCFIKKSFDNFNSWEDKIGGINNHQDNSFLEINFPSANTGFALSRTNLYKTTDHGQNWISLPLKNGFHPSEVQFMDNLHGVISGWYHTHNDSLFARTTDGGNTWQFVPLGIDGYYLGSEMCFTDVDHGWILTEGTPYVHYFLRTQNGGISWQVDTLYSPFFNDISKLQFTDQHNAWFIVDRSKIVNSGNGGIT
jgi:photosystem II stability/assembly factor-like uncharacterized protein